jgi:hypothetical protein
MDAESAKAYRVAVAWESFGVAETPAEYVFHRPRLYLETTIPSFLTARPSRDLAKSRMQWITARWWNSWRTQFHIYVSTIVLKEARKGDPEAARRRLDILEPIQVVDHNPRSYALADRLMASSAMPPDSRNDAEHIAIASVHEITFLLSWNCAHLANTHTSREIAEICRSEGYCCPTLCTPQTLLERYEHGHIT